MFKLQAEIDEVVLKKLVRDYLEENGIAVTIDAIHIEVKSKQNYKSEWEEASFRATVSYTSL